jgi:hypothetical protein
MAITISGSYPLNSSTNNNVNQQVRFYVSDSEGNIDTRALYVEISGSVIKGYGDLTCTASNWEWQASSLDSLMHFTASHLSGSFYNYNDSVSYTITYDITRIGG